MQTRLALFTLAAGPSYVIHQHVTSHVTSPTVHWRRARHSPCCTPYSPCCAPRRLPFATRLAAVTFIPALIDIMLALAGHASANQKPGNVYDVDGTADKNTPSSPKYGRVSLTSSSPSGSCGRWVGEWESVDGCYLFVCPPSVVLTLTGDN